MELLCTVDQADILIKTSGPKAATLQAFVMYTLIQVTMLSFAILGLRCEKQQLFRLYKFEHNLLSDKSLKTICFQFYCLGVDWALLNMPCLKPMYTVYGAHFITCTSHSHTLINLFHHFSVLQ